MNKLYKSKIGLEIILILAATFGSIAVVMVIDGDYSPLLINVFIVAVIAYVFFFFLYEISGNNLNVKCSFLVNKDIDITSIRKIKETYNPISAPAASIDRLEITYNHDDTILISPKKKEDFINHLKKINPAILVDYRNK